MDDLVHQGKVLYWGTSNSHAKHIEAYATTARELNAYSPRAEQPHYCMLCDDRAVKEEILTTCARYGMGVTVYSPLAQGVLTGKYNDGIPVGSRAALGQWEGHDLEGQVAIARRLAPLAAELGLEMGQLALAWILRRPEVSTVIIGATKPEHIQSNALASGERLSADVLGEIDRLLMGELGTPIGNAG
jgi:aryl-alcohol dehydrogenase-like predicted oxidoreductase